MELRITEKLQEGISENKEVLWLKFKTEDDQVVAFWGEFGNPNRNITALKNQSLPVVVDILDPDECFPTKNEESNHKLSWSIPSNVCIQINPEL